MSRLPTSQPLPASAASSLEYRMLSERRSDEARAIRKASLAQGRDYSPRRGKILVPRADGQVQTIPTALTMDHYVLVTQKSTHRPSEPTSDTLSTAPSVTSKKLTQPSYPILDYLLGDSLASLSALLANAGALAILGEPSSLMSLGFCSTKDPDIWYSKTSKVYLLTTVEKLSRKYLGFLPTWGTELNGWYLTAPASAFPKTVSASTLSDIVEENAPARYYLSHQAIAKLAIPTLQAWLALGDSHR